MLPFLVSVLVFSTQRKKEGKKKPKGFRHTVLMYTAVVACMVNPVASRSLWVMPVRSCGCSPGMSCHFSALCFTLSLLASLLVPFFFVSSSARGKASQHCRMRELLRVAR